MTVEELLKILDKYGLDTKIEIVELDDEGEEVESYILNTAEYDYGEEVIKLYKEYHPHSEEAVETVGYYDENLRYKVIPNKPEELYILLDEVNLLESPIWEFAKQVELLTDSSVAIIIEDGLAPLRNFTLEGLRGVDRKVISLTAENYAKLKRIKNTSYKYLYYPNKDKIYEFDSFGGLVKAVKVLQEDYKKKEEEQEKQEALRVLNKHKENIKAKYNAIQDR